MSLQQSVIKTAMEKAIKLHNAGDLDQAETIYRNILARVPKTADAFNLLGLIYNQRGAHLAAVDLINKAIQLDKKKAQYYNSLGNVLKDHGERKSAEKAFRKAVKLKPKYTSALNNLGTSFLEAGNLSSAISMYQKTLKIKPDFHAAMLNLGNAYYEKGDTIKALECYRDVLDKAPLFTKAARNMVEAKTFKSRDADFERLKQLAENDSLNGEDKANALFAYAKALDDLKSNTEAFKVFVIANDTYRNTIKYNFADDRNLMAEIRTTITADFLRQYHSSGVFEYGPIFVLGMPRSGTSLVEQILASHPDVIGAGELYTLEKTVFNFVFEKGTKRFSEGLGSNIEDKIMSMATDYLQQVKRLSAKSNYFIDKMPRNFLYVGLIKTLLPNAKIIHCRRQAEDSCLSMFKLHFASQQHFTYNLEELAEYYNDYLDHMDHWRNIMPEGFYEIDYESLIADQLSETERLLEYCSLDWNDACLEFYKTKRVVRTASTHQVRQPIYSNSVSGWKKYESELTPLTSILNSRQ